MPTTSGSSAARPRKNSSESTNSSGNASSSARPRSSDTVSPIWWPATAGPPTVTSRAAGEGGDRGLARRPPRRRSALQRSGHERVGPRGPRCRVRATPGSARADRATALGVAPPRTSRRGRARSPRRSRACSCARPRPDSDARRRSRRRTQLAGDGAAHHPREDDEGEQEEEGAPRASGGGAAESFEHAAMVLGAPARTSARGCHFAARCSPGCTHLVTGRGCWALLVRPVRVRAPGSRCHQPERRTGAPRGHGEGIRVPGADDLDGTRQRFEVTATRACRTSTSAHADHAHALAAGAAGSAESPGRGWASVQRSIR